MNEPVRNLAAVATSTLNLPRATFAEMKTKVGAINFATPQGLPEFYPGPNIGAPELGRLFHDRNANYVRMACQLLATLEPDKYTQYLQSFYEAGLVAYGDAWGYGDIVTALLGLSDMLKPKHYLEIGVRRGRSASAVGWRAPHCSMMFFDMWMKNYAGMENPGPALVSSELAKVGHRGKVEYIDGNSHETLPRFFKSNPDAAFDIITVDGDHSDLGAAQDLVDVMPHLKIGGALVFDDIAHPTHPGLRDVWREVVEADRRFTVYNYLSVGYGVGFAIRRY